MHARDIAIDVPTVTLADSVATAVAVMARQRLPGLIVVDQQQRPRVVLPGTQVLRMSIATGIQEGAGLARTVDEEHADAFWRDAGDRTVSECLPPKLSTGAIVDEDATLLELVVAMARSHSPLVAVTRADGTLLGGVALSALLDHLDLPTEV